MTRPPTHPRRNASQDDTCFFYEKVKAYDWINSISSVVFFFFFCVVISAASVARPLYYSTSPVSVDPSTCGSVSPARKAASVLEPNPGIADKPVITHEVSVKPTYCVTVQQQKVWT